jgi:CRISPR-associated protein Csm5
MQQELFYARFSSLAEDAEQPMQKSASVVLGGGTGYQSKTITYPLFKNQQRAVKVVGRMMTKQFNNHKHELDSEKYKVSPHMLKTTMYNGKYYQMGKCSIEFIG